MANAAFENGQLLDKEGKVRRRPMAVVCCMGAQERTADGLYERFGGPANDALARRLIETGIFRLPMVVESWTARSLCEMFENDRRLSKLCGPLYVVTHHNRDISWRPGRKKYSLRAIEVITQAAAVAWVRQDWAIDSVISIATPDMAERCHRATQLVFDQLPGCQIQSFITKEFDSAGQGWRRNERYVPLVDEAGRTNPHKWTSNLGVYRAYDACATLDDVATLKCDPRARLFTTHNGEVAATATLENSLKVVSRQFFGNKGLDL